MLRHYTTEVALTEVSRPPCGHSRVHLTRLVNEILCSYGSVKQIYGMQTPHKHKDPTCWFQVPRQGGFQKPRFASSSCFCGLLGRLVLAFVICRAPPCKLRRVDDSASQKHANDGQLLQTIQLTGHKEETKLFGAYTYSCMYIHVNIYIYRYMHTHVYTYIHMYILGNLKEAPQQHCSPRLSEKGTPPAQPVSVAAAEEFLKRPQVRRRILQGLPKDSLRLPSVLD